MNLFTVDRNGLESDIRTSSTLSSGDTLPRREIDSSLSLPLSIAACHLSLRMVAFLYSEPSVQLSVLTFTVNFSIFLTDYFMAMWWSLMYTVYVSALLVINICSIVSVSRSWYYLHLMGVVIKSHTHKRKGISEAVNVNIIIVMAILTLWLLLLSEGGLVIGDSK